ncbi:MAG: serine hydrolase [Woeseia sp.]|jgi:6-aminohexanoate-oligomer exohydrolase|nr:serine hydrolase [Woeseia sp.]
MRKLLLTFGLLLLSITAPTLADESPPHVVLNFDYDDVNLENWNEPENRHWSWWNLGALMPFPVEIGRGSLPVHEFGKHAIDLSEITTSFEGRKINLAEYFDHARVDGFLVVKNNNIVYEAYPRQMRRHDRHIVMSSSKSFIAAVLGDMVEADTIDLSATIEQYIPDIGQGYSGVTMQEALDMNAPIKWSEDYKDAHAEGVVIFRAEAMHPGYEEWPGGARDFLRSLRKSDNHIPGNLHYVTANASVVGWALTEITGIPWNRLAQKAIWEKIGADQNAMNFEDQTGYGQSSGSFVMTLRDFARYAQIYANKGTAENGQRVFSENWFEIIVDNPNATRSPESDNRYSHFIQVHSNGAMSHTGYGGQVWYSNHNTGVVIVQMATLDTPSASSTPQVNQARVELLGKIDAFLSQ